MLLALPNFDEFVRFEVILLHDLLLLVSVEQSLRVRLLFSLLLNKYLVATGNLDLLVFERQGDAEIVLVLLKENSLLTLVVIVINVVTERVLKRMHIPNALNVLVPTAYKNKHINRIIATYWTLFVKFILKVVSILFISSRWIFLVAILTLLYCLTRFC